MIIYAGYAAQRRQGWPVGAWLSQGSLFLIVPTVCWFWALYIAFVRFYWWSPIVVTLLAFLFAAIALPLFKWRAQIIAFVGLVGGFALCLAWVL